MTKWTFERVVRDCLHNKQTQAKGTNRGLLVDFKILRDGVHVGWWYQYGANGRTDARGFRYWLRDRLHACVSNGKRYPQEHCVAARSQQDFESVIAANDYRIPSEKMLKERIDKRARESADRERKDEAERKDRLLRDAAPEMYEALELAQTWLANSIPTHNLDGPKPLPLIAAVLAKARGEVTKVEG